MSYRFYTHIGPSEYSACLYYRTLLPITTMEKLGLNIMPVVDRADGRTWNQERLKMFLESDITFLYQSIGADILDLVKTSKALKPMNDHDLQMRWPPTIICDTDDDLFNVMPLNFSYKYLGIRDHNGNMVPDGAEIGMAHPMEVASDAEADTLNGDGSPKAGEVRSINQHKFVFTNDGKWHLYVPLYKDGNNIDFAANRQRIETWKNIASQSNLVTCSTARAAEYVKREIGEDVRTFVTPNAINFDEYPEVELSDHPSEVRILWQGSASHQEDLWPLTESLGRVAKKYPHATFWFFGSPYKWAAKNLDIHRFKFIEWLPYEQFKLRLSMLNHDINLAPLHPTVFNQSRSAIKWYESSAIWKPAATIAQTTGAYQDEIQDGETGMLFTTPEEFEEKLGALIESETLRKTIASNAKDWIRTNRDHKKIALNLFQKWTEVREGHKLTMPTTEETPSAIPERN